MCAYIFTYIYIYIYITYTHDDRMKLCTISGALFTGASRLAATTLACARRLLRDCSKERARSHTTLCRGFPSRRRYDRSHTTLNGIHAFLHCMRACMCAYHACIHAFACGDPCPHSECWYIYMHTVYIHAYCVHACILYARASIYMTAYICKIHA
jgi:hypothetical protein